MLIKVEVIFAKMYDLWAKIYFLYTTITIFILSLRELDGVFTLPRYTFCQRISLYLCVFADDIQFEKLIRKCE